MENASHSRCFDLLTVEHYYEAAKALAHLLSDRLEHRVASRLALLAERAGAQTPLDIAVTQTDLAEMCASGGLSVHQALKRLGELGIVETGYRRIRIEDFGRLLAFCAEPN